MVFCYSDGLDLTFISVFYFPVHLHFTAAEAVAQTTILVSVVLVQLQVLLIESFHNFLTQICNNTGNKRYRKLVEDRKIDYVNSKRLDKPLVALEIIRHWRAQDPPGRFLKMDNSGMAMIEPVGLLDIPVPSNVPNCCFYFSCIFRFMV